MDAPSPLFATLIVALGGGIGAALRYHAGRIVGRIAGLQATYPWPTFTINVVGSFAMGILAGWLARNGSGGETWRLLIGVGVLGGFTTFSAFSLEIALLIEKGMIGLAAAYAATSIVAGAVGLFAGLAIMRGAA